MAWRFGYDPGMRVGNIHAARSHLSQLTADVERGEEILIARRGKVVARLVEPAQRRELGWAQGEIVEVDPNWHEPMSDEEVREMFGNEFADDSA